MAHTFKYRIHAYTGGYGAFMRHPQHRQQLAEFYAAKAIGHCNVSVPHYVIIEGAWADQFIDTPHGHEAKSYENHQEYMNVLRTRKRRHIARRKCRKAKEKMRLACFS